MTGWVPGEVAGLGGAGGAWGRAVLHAMAEHRKRRDRIERSPKGSRHSSGGGRRRAHTPGTTALRSLAQTRQDKQPENGELSRGTNLSGSFNAV